jgi:hypothetical protein
LEDEPEAGMPDIAKEKDLMEALSVGQVQEIVANAKSQNANVSDERLLEAFLYYYDNDAFITFK